MSTILDISTFVYQTGTLTVAPGDTTAVFDGAGLSTVAKDGDYLFAGGSLAVIKTVTDDAHVELFTEWAGLSVNAGSYLILKASLLRYHTALIGYDAASFLALLDGANVWYAVEGDEPDPSLGEDSNRALKSNITPWKIWLKTGGVWVLQPGSPGGPGATIVAQSSEPGTDYPTDSLWIDSGSADLDVYTLTGAPPAWTDAGIKLKGAIGPVAWLPPVAWTTGQNFVVGPPASVVTEGGESYVCLETHTSGIFATDLAAGKWIKVAAKGADGTGIGDVVGPVSATDAHIVLFDTATGKKIQDGGKSLADLATAEQGDLAESAVQPGDLGSAAFESASSFATAAQGAKADTALQSFVLPNYIAGLTLSTAGSSSTFGIAKGVATDAAASFMMTLATAYTKTTSAWAVGSGNGALDTGTIANNTWYHVWLIQRSDTGVVDALISASATAPTMPTNYDRKRRIGSMKTNGSGQWIKFVQDGDYFGWDVPAQDVNVSNPGATAVLRALSVPAGVRVRALMAASIDGNPGTAQPANLYISDPLASDVAPSAISATSIAAYNGGASTPELLNGAQVQCFTNTSSQVRTRASNSASGSVVFIITLGWQDNRGKDA